jgi:hypothetical protein
MNNCSSGGRTDNSIERHSLPLPPQARDHLDHINHQSSTRRKKKKKGLKKYTGVGGKRQRCANKQLSGLQKYKSTSASPLLFLPPSLHPSTFAFYQPPFSSKRAKCTGNELPPPPSDTEEWFVRVLFFLSYVVHACLCVCVCVISRS